MWQATLDSPSSQIDGYRRTLSTDEHARAKRFYFDRDRNHFIVARGLLRNILGIYLKREPASLSFEYGSHGKPGLTPGINPNQIDFNLSHSNGMALYAIARDRALGIDLEFIRGDPQAESIAERFFSSQEIATLRALPGTAQRYAFFLCWTRKEAYIKARGEGLSLPLHQFDTTLIPGEPAELLGTRPDPLEASRWSLMDLTLEPPGYAAAVAVKGRGWSISLWKWPPPREGRS